MESGKYPVAYGAQASSLHRERNISCAGLSISPDFEEARGHEDSNEG